MAFFSLSAKRRLGGPNRLEPSSAFTSGTEAPTVGEALELRINEGELNKLTTGEAQRLLDLFAQEVRRRILNGELTFGGPN